MNKTRVISIANSKGGVGKSTITMHLGSALAKQKKKKVLIIDTDSQRTIMDFYDGEKSTNEGQPLVTVEEMAGRQVLNFLKRWGNDYDIVFIDIPRMTEKKGDSGATTLLSYCDSVLIPVIGSQVDVLSTIDFIQIIRQIEEERKELDFNFNYASFINRRNRRKDNQLAESFLKEQNLKVFSNSLPDLKLLSNPSLFKSLLDSSQGKERFKPFFDEFCKTFKIK